MSFPVPVALPSVFEASTSYGDNANPVVRPSGTADSGRRTRSRSSSSLPALRIGPSSVRTRCDTCAIAGMKLRTLDPLALVIEPSMQQGAKYGNRT